MKKIIILLISAAIFLCSCGADTATDTITDIINYPATDGGEMRACWLSYLELDMEDKSEKGFESGVEKLIKKAADTGLNTVFVHTVSHCDAYYNSKLLPMSKYVAGKRGGSLSYDPLSVVIKVAKAYKMSVHAWINPFRISADKREIADWQKDDIAVKMLSQSAAHAADGGVYLIPSALSAQKLMLDAVREIVSNYDIAGVHFDDYFYPTTDSDFDKAQYDKYKSLAGDAALSLADYRRAAVDSFVSAVYGIVKQRSQSLLFGISPQADIDKNRETLYADVAKWCNNEGYIDYIMPQIYFGFEYPTERFRFDKMLDEWLKIKRSGVRLMIGLGLYRSGEEQTIGSQKSREWCDKTDIIARQVGLIREKKADGFAVFSAGSLISKQKETENLKKVLMG